jgi:quinone-modifying oxidoreductase subunit QmoC
MSEKVIKPDLGFVKAIISNGGESLKKCYQCATCTVVCNVTPDDKPFPRKEMLHAQWGLKRDLFANPDIWLCHQCSDCTAYCPRGAKPGEVLGAVRKLSLQQYSAPSWLAKAVGEARFLPLVLLLPILVIGGLVSVNKDGHFSSHSTLEAPANMIIFDRFVPVHLIDPVFTAAFFFAVAMLGWGVMRYWKDLSRGLDLKGTVGEALGTTVKEILAHSKFEKCEVTGQRKTSHMFVLYSFLGLAATTALAVVYMYFIQGFAPPPGMEFSAEKAKAAAEMVSQGHTYRDGLANPVKIIGNISALALLVGIFLVFVNRLNNAAKAGLGSYYDWLFITLVAVIAVTGIGAEATRFAGMASVAYPVYFVHLAAVFFLFLYAPFSKMAHMVYRATAMVFAKMAGRE